jgi:hypothetical protein
MVSLRVVTQKHLNTYLDSEFLKQRVHELMLPKYEIWEAYGNLNL